MEKPKVWGGGGGHNYVLHFSLIHTPESPVRRPTLICLGYVYLFNFFMEVSIAKRPFEHILWPEVFNSR